DDRVPSLSIKEGSDGRVLLHCHAGCSIDDILRALGLARRDLFPASLPLSAPTQVRATEPKPALPVKPRPPGELLAEVRDTLRRYVSFQLMEQPTAIALWVLHTWAFDAAYFTPYLHVFSAETSSGKSRLLEVLALLVNKPWKL